MCSMTTLRCMMAAGALGASLLVGCRGGAATASRNSRAQLETPSGPQLTYDMPTANHTDEIAAFPPEHQPTRSASRRTSLTYPREALDY